MTRKAEARCWAVLPAAGTGSRMGAELPKQYMVVAGATLLEHSLRALLNCEQISGIRIREYKWSLVPSSATVLFWRGLMP
jgi:2-C-methyl-D-erythritol 4-phosphate cytidylyltransferase